MSKRFTMVFENEDVAEAPAAPIEAEEVVPAEEYEVETDLAQEDAEERAEGELAAGEVEGEGDLADETLVQIDNAVAIEEMLNDIASELEGNERVFEVTDGLSDISDIVNSTPDGETVDIPMLQTAANMAVAGTDADAQSIIPAIESFSDKKLAMEAIGEKIKSAITSVMNGFKDISEKSMVLIGRMFKSIKFFEGELSKRETAVKALTDGKVKYNLKVTNGLLKSHDSFVSDAQDYVKSLISSVSFFKAFTTSIVTGLGNFDGVAGEFYKSLGNKQLTEERNIKLCKTFFDTFKTGMEKLPGVKVSAGSDGVNTIESGELLGAYALKITVPSKTPEFDKNPLPVVKEAVAKTSFSFTSTKKTKNQKEATSKERVTFDISKAELLVIIGQIRELLNNSKKLLDQRYKSFKTTTTLTNAFVLRTRNNDIKTGEMLSFSFGVRTISKAMNSAAKTSAMINSYSKVLLTSTLSVVDAAVRASKVAKPATEGYVEEKFSGWLAGFFTAGIPVIGGAITAAVKANLEAKRKEIIKIADELQLVRSKQIKTAIKTSKDIPSDKLEEYKVELTYEPTDFLIGFIFGSIPLIGNFINASNVSAVQDLTEELNDKLRELNKVIKATNIDTSSIKVPATPK